VSIRRAQPADAPAIAAVHVRSWQAAYRGLLPADYLNGLDPAQRTARWEATLRGLDWPGRGVLVAEQDGQVVGFAGFSPTRDADLDPLATGEVATIYLLPQAWRQGHGRGLMAGALASLGEAGFREAALWVLDTNQRARRFYEAGGWRPDGAAKLEERPEAGLTLSEVRYRCRLPARNTPPGRDLS